MGADPRGVRLNNPGNIEHGDPWQGLAKAQPDERFCAFQTPAWGFRAMAVTLCTYQDRYGVKNIGQAISRWAPSSENDTGAYIQAVCQATKKAPDEPVNFHDYNDAYGIIRAITIHEQGSFDKYFTKAQIDQGCIKAGLENAPVGVAGSIGRVTAGAAAAAGTYAANDPSVLVSTYNTVKPIIDVAPHLIQKGFWCVAVGAIVLLAYGEFKKVKGAK